MSDKPTTHIVSIDDIPPDTMLSYDDVAHLLFGTTKARFVEASHKGKAPRGVRMTRKSPMHWRAGHLAAYIKERMAPLEAGQ